MEASHRTSSGASVGSTPSTSTTFFVSNTNTVTNSTASGSIESHETYWDRVVALVKAAELCDASFKARIPQLDIPVLGEPSVSAACGAVAFGKMAFDSVTQLVFKRKRQQLRHLVRRIVDLAQKIKKCPMPVNWMDDFDILLNNITMFVHECGRKSLSTKIKYRHHDQDKLEEFHEEIDQLYLAGLRIQATPTSV